MRRRAFIKILGGAAAAWPLKASAQQAANLPLVAVITPFTEELATERAAALRLGLKQAGFIEGTHYVLAQRFANGDYSRFPELARELDALKPRVFVVTASAAAIATTRKQAPDTPLVFAGIAADPIAAGYAESYARPGGMMTGAVMNAVGGEESLTSKRIGFFKELVPGLTRLGMIGFADSVNPVPSMNLAIPERNALRKAATHFGFEFSSYDIKTLDDLDAAVSSGLRDEISAFYISGDPRMNLDIPRVVASLAKSGKPTCAVYPFWARAGLLMSYSTDPNDGMRRVGFQVAKIIRGAKPGELPIEQAVKFTLVINQKTARQLGITPSPILLAEADEVIE
jgi:putative tryptophan/tyrosine transport system substrate-binding protein